MKKFIAAGLLAALFLGTAQAQDQALVVSSCGTPPVTYTAGQVRMPTVDTTGKLCLSSSGIPPTGAAGGSLAGTYPNPSLATAQPNASTWAAIQTFSVAPVFTNQSGTRSALGLGTAAIQNTGTSGANVPLLNGANTWAAIQTFSVAPVFTDQSGTRSALGLGALATVTPGTGVATALGINIGSAGAPVLFNGAGGTPSSLVGTNITGTASGLTAGSVTTNANLTGAVTSVGNAATIASTISAGGPTGSATVVPVITYNAAGQLTTVTTATIASPVTSKLLTTARDLTTATGTQAITGMGFLPSSCNGQGSISASSTLNSIVYHSMSDSTKAASALYAGQNGVSNSATTVGSSFFFVQDVSGSNWQAATIQSYDADGLTLSWTKTGTPTGTFSFSIRCFK